MNSDQIQFDGESFCFTGTLSELKRTQAERLVRARGGYTMSIVGMDLDYLVVGSIPSPGWKHGNYGTKIEKALTLAKENNGKPIILQEADFMESVAATPETDDSESDEKVVVCRYKFLAKKGEYDDLALDTYLNSLSEQQGCFVTAYSDEASLLASLFSTSFQIDDLDNLDLIRIRIVKQLPTDTDTQVHVDSIAKGFEVISGIDGRIDYFERTEGTASFISLLSEIQTTQRLKRNK
jgi:hypothetical protein